MNLNELHGKLIAAARATPPDDRVPHTFEKRIMARLAGQTAPDSWALWGGALSRAAVFSVGFMLLLSAGSYFLPSGGQDSLSQDVDQTLFAAVDNSNSLNADQQDTW